MPDHGRARAGSGHGVEAPVLESRIKIFSNLRIEGLDRLSLQNRLDDIGKIRDAAGSQDI